MTDTQPWEAFMGIGNNLYMFDLGVIPARYWSVYNGIPDGYQAIEIENKMYITRVDAWGKVS